jgi:hypothetical protein
VLHQAHAGVAGPALFVVVADDVLVVGVLFWFWSVMVVGVVGGGGRKEKKKKEKGEFSSELKFFRRSPPTTPRFSFSLDLEQKKTKQKLTGCSVRYLPTRSLASSAVSFSSMCTFVTWRE